MHCGVEGLWNTRVNYRGHLMWVFCILIYLYSGVVGFCSTGFNWQGVHLMFTYEPWYI